MKKRRRIVWLAALILLALAGASMLLSKYGLEVTRLELGFDGLPAGFDGFKIVQLSDLHGSSFGQDNEKLIEKIREEEPELIALTGDFLDEGKAGRELPELSGLVSELIRIAPVYFVSGNHDWASGEVHTLFETLEEAGAVCLRNEYLTLERNGSRLILCGVEDPNGPADMETPEELVARLRASEPESFVLMLAHRAYWAEKYPELDVDLILCGHTHGGIVRLPLVGGLAASNMGLFPEYDAGLFELPAYKLFISRGLGNSVPLPRFLNTPEIVSITLRTE